MPPQLDVRRHRTNYVRRGIGILVGGAPVLLLTASIVRAVTRGDSQGTIAIAVMLIAVAVGLLNFYLSAIRPSIFRRINGSLDTYKHVSGIPMIGSLVVIVGAILGFGSVLCAALGVLAVWLDTGGSVWFVIATWKDASFWDDGDPSVGGTDSSFHDDAHRE